MSRPFIINNLFRAFVISWAVVFGMWLNEKSPAESYISAKVEELRQEAKEKGLSVDEQIRRNKAEIRRNMQKALAASDAEHALSLQRGSN